MAGTVGAVLTMKKVGGFAGGEESGASYEVVAVKPSTNVSSLSRCSRRVVVHRGARGDTGTVVREWKREELAGELFRFIFP